MNETRVDEALHHIKTQTENMRARGHVQAALARLYAGDTDVDALLDIDEFRFSDGDIHPTEGDFGIYWAIPAMVHLMMKFGDKIGPGARNTVMRVLHSFYYVDGHNVVKPDASPHRLYLSENHDSLLKVNLYLLARYMDGELTQPLDGMSAAEVEDALTRYLHNALDTMLDKGWLIEGGEPYNAVTLESFYNLMELSGDPALSAKAKRFIDLYWLLHAAESVNNVRGYARARLYPYWEDNGSCWVSSLFEVYTGCPAIQSHGMMDYLVLFPYRPPAAVMDILKAREDMPPYTVTTKVRGGGYYVLEELRKDEPMPLGTPVYYMDVYSQMLRTTYVTGHYNVSGFHYPLRQPLTMIASQCRWEGATFAQPQGSAVYAGNETQDAALFDSFMTLHHKNAILYAPNKNAYWHDRSTNPVTIVNRGDAAYTFRMQLKIQTKGAQLELDEVNDNLLTGRFGDNFFAFITDGGFSMEDGGKIIVNSQCGALLVSHAAEQSYQDFCTGVRRAEAQFTQGKIRLCYGGDTLELYWQDDSNHCRLINGEPMDYLTQNYVSSPFVNGKTGGDKFKITVGKEGTSWL